MCWYVAKAWLHHDLLQMQVKDPVHKKTLQKSWSTSLKLSTRINKLVLDLFPSKYFPESQLGPLSTKFLAGDGFVRVFQWFPSPSIYAWEYITFLSIPVRVQRFVWRGIAGIDGNEWLQFLACYCSSTCGSDGFSPLIGSTFAQTTRHVTFWGHLGSYSLHNWHS